MSYNSDKVSKSLKLINRILNENKIKHVYFGSIIPAAINGSLHRNLGDFDIFIDIKKNDLFIRELKKNGYYSKARGIWKFVEAFNLFDYHHPKLLEISYFAMDFGKNYTFLRANDFPFEVKIDNKAVKPTLYKLLNIDFLGIPENTAYTGALIQKTNPKRIKEFEVFKKNKITPRKNNYLNVYWGKLRINWSYNLINYVLKVLGIIRVKLGFAYDPWR